MDGELHRIRHGRQKRFVAILSQGPMHRPARVAVTLALAHKIRQGILSGEIQNQADAARKLGLTRARLSQILEMTNLAPDLQEEILFLEAIDDREPLSERALRGVVRVTTWAEQRVSRRRDCCSAPPASPYAAAILDDGFEYRGDRYRSLSNIARAITGTPWNG
jgi:hypothetical protein